MRKTPSLGGHTTHISFDERGSGQWIYDKLRQLGLSEAKATFYVDGTDEEKNLVYLPYTYLNSKVERGEPILIADDFALSGSQIAEHVLDSFETENFDTIVLLQRATAYAMNSIANYDAMPRMAGGPIRTMMETFSEEEIDYFENHVDFFAGDSALFWSWYKMPDNLPRMFTGKAEFPPLIRPEKFRPPYKNR